MVRLPQPGGDAGNWGDILNEYLSQSHKSDGTLADNVVTSNAIAPNSITNASIATDAVNATSIADGTITNMQLADDTIQEGKLSNAVRTKINSTAPVTKVAGRTGDVVLDKTDVGLANVSNTSDASKPISTATQSALDAKVSKTTTSVIDTANIITFNRSTTQAFQPGKESVATAPFGRMWHDWAAFGRAWSSITQEVRTESTWTTDAVNMNLFARKENQAYQLADGVTTNAVRWTIVGTQWAIIDWAVLGFTHTAPEATRIVRVESSANGSTWTTRHESTSTGVTRPFYHALSAIDADNYMRITVESVSGAIRMSHIALLTARPGDQGRGSEYELPFSWTATKDITVEAELVVQGVARSAVSPTASDHLTRKDYVDGLNTGNVKTSGDQSIAGNKSFSNQVRVTGGANRSIVFDGSQANHVMEIGRTDGVASTPYIDFHSGATSIDHDARIIASGGNGTNGQGTLTISAGILQVPTGTRLGTSSVAGQVWTANSTNGGGTWAAPAALTSSMGVVVHGATASTARPAGYTTVTWIGSVQPTNAVANDVWVYKP